MGKRRGRTIFQTKDDVSAYSPCLEDAEDGITLGGSPLYFSAGEIFHD